MKQFTILFFLLFTMGMQLNAQGIRGYLAFGFNLTEAKLTGTGNSQVGTRMGLNLGPGVSLMLNKRWETSVEMLYSQNGNYVEITQLPNAALDKITLNYIEVPLTLAYRFNLKKSEPASFYNCNISGGIAFAHLFNHKIRAIDGTDLTDDVRFDKESALLFNIGATFPLSKSFSVNGRGTLSTFGKWTAALRLLYYI